MISSAARDYRGVVLAANEPDGNDIMVVVSSNDEAEFWAIMANPQTDFDRWYRKQIEAIWEFDASPPIAPAMSSWAPGRPG